MGLGDLFKASENKDLRKRIEELEAALTPEMQDAIMLKKQLADLSNQLEQKQQEIKTATESLSLIQSDIESAKEALVETNDRILLQEFGLYEPKYDFASSEEYSVRLQDIRKRQKQMVKAKIAATGSSSWTVNGNAKQGEKMVSDMKKLLLRAFNNECDDVISKVKFNNIDAGAKRILTSKNVISKLGSVMGVAITDAYYNLKLEELYLAYEYQLKKQEEKEHQRQIREELREQAKLQKEIEAARKNINKDKTHHENALAKLMDRMNTESDPAKKSELEKKAEELKSQIESLQEELKAVDYREANQKAGYVYIISNIGAFGENIYKIGMTRRLDPMDRVDELGDASVPFKFDVHALIFTEDAPKLETALHHAFEDKKVNMVNNRREFFHVSLDEIKRVVRENYDKTVEFVDIPDAEQYRQSLLMRSATTE